MIRIYYNGLSDTSIYEEYKKVIIEYMPKTNITNLVEDNLKRIQVESTLENSIRDIVYLFMEKMKLTSLKLVYSFPESTGSSTKWHIDYSPNNTNKRFKVVVENFVDKDIGRIFMENFYLFSSQIYTESGVFTIDNSYIHSTHHGRSCAESIRQNFDISRGDTVGKNRL